MKIFRFLIITVICLFISSSVISQQRSIDEKFIKAVEENKIEEVKLLIKNGANINVKREKYGYTALHISVNKGNMEITRYIILKGAKLNIKDNEGYTPIHGAALRSDFKMSELLIKSKCDINAAGEFNYTPLHFIAKRGEVELAKLFIENGANVNAREGEFGFTPLRLSLDDGVYGKQSFALAKYFINNGADINSKDNWGETLLHSAIISGNLKTINFLISNGADLNLKVSSGNHDYSEHSPVQIAIKEKRQDIVKLLLKNGAK